MAKKTYEQIQTQIAALQAEADKIRRKELDEVISRIREAITFYGITATDLGLDSKAATRKKAGTGNKAAGKTTKSAPSTVVYRDEQGREWRGRGKRPQWLRDALIAGRSLDDFRVKTE